MMALAGCFIYGSSDPEESVTSGTEAGAVPDTPTATRLDEAIGRAMTEASIPGAIVGIWGLSKPGVPSRVV
jgi:D-alanyl-D-alanine carboxypeptidase